MAEISRFFNSIDHDRLYSAADWAAYFASFIGNGVMPLPSSQLFVSPGAGEGLSLAVAPGHAFIGGYAYELTASQEVTLATADGANPRIDRVVVRYSRSQRNIALAVLTGTPAASPTAPALTRTGDVYDLSLCRVTVARGATSISSSVIRDERGDTSVCGFCTWLFYEAGANYDDFWEQFRAQFADWMESVEDQLDPETAAGLAARLADLTPVDASLTLTTSGWVSDTASGGMRQDIAAASVLDGGGNPITLSNATKADADLDMSAATVDTAEALENNWALIGRIAVDASGVHAYCYGDLPSAAVPFILRISMKR